MYTTYVYIYYLYIYTPLQIYSNDVKNDFRGSFMNPNAEESISVRCATICFQSHACTIDPRDIFVFSTFSSISAEFFFFLFAFSNERRSRTNYSRRVKLLRVVAVRFFVVSPFFEKPMEMSNKIRFRHGGEYANFFFPSHSLYINILLITLFIFFFFFK